MKQVVWETYKQYHSIQRLSQSPLATGVLMEGVTWQGDTPMLHGYVVQGALLWVVRLLGNGNQFERQSSTILHLRYVQGLSVAECMSELHIVNGAVKKRQRVAVERAANLLREAAANGIGFDERRQLAVAARYAACSADSLPQLHFWSIFREPVAIEAANALSTPLQPHLADLIALNWIVQSADNRLQLHPSGVA